MKLPEKERAAHREAFRQMTPAGKIEYIYTYFKWPIILAVVAAVILGSTVYRFATKKDAVLYAAYVNVTVGTELETRLSNDYLSANGLDPRKKEVFFYRDLYISEDPAAEDHEFAYASNMKLMATITAEDLDLVLMNRESYDILSGKGYLMELSGLFDSEAILPCLTANTVILEDNSIAYNLGQAAEYTAVTEESVNAIEVSRLPLFTQAGFDDAVYLGIIGNTPRLDTCVNYCEYLASAATAE